jgi:hypothetical protein
VATTCQTESAKVAVLSFRDANSVAARISARCVPPNSLRLTTEDAFVEPAWQTSTLIQTQELANATRDTT